MFPMCAGGLYITVQVVLKLMVHVTLQEALALRISLWFTVLLTPVR